VLFFAFMVSVLWWALTSSVYKI